jgi:predicted site-specific integrase-resolvase
MNAPALPALYTPKQASAYLGIAPRTLRALAQAGAIGSVALTPARRAYTADDLAAYVARVRRPATGAGAEEVSIGRVLPNVRTK